jgi:hypothetical protein
MNTGYGDGLSLFPSHAKESNPSGQTTTTVFIVDDGMKIRPFHRDPELIYTKGHNDSNIELIVTGMTWQKALPFSWLV